MTSHSLNWRMPTFVIAIVVGFEFVLLALLLLPRDAKFAEDFRTSCFGYDPVTGMVAWIVVFTTFTVPLIVGLVISISWNRELRAVLESSYDRVAACVALGVAAGMVTAVTWASASGTNEAGELPFPAKALRSGQPAPEFELKDHMGRTVRLADFRGRVVLVTAIFSRCSYSCPMILRDVQKAVTTLPSEQVDDLRVAVITLDPENDTPEVLAKVAAARGFTSPTFHLLTGEAATVERTLDDFAVPRSRDADTGLINHADLFILIDRRGRVAYRFTLDERKQHWLGTALRQLLDERNSDI